MAATDSMQKKILMGIIAVLVIVGGIYFVGNNGAKTPQPAQTSDNGAVEYNKGHALAKEKKYKEALDMYIQSAAKGNRYGMNAAGMYLCNGYGGIEKDVTKGIDYLTKAADAGFSPAQVNLGRAYMNPQYGLKRDLDKGLKYFLAAAEQNNADAMLYMGFNYEVGRGVEKSKEKALEWYEKAEKLGNKAAKKRADSLRNQ